MSGDVPGVAEGQAGGEPPSGRSPLAALRFRGFFWFMVAQISGNCSMWMSRTTQVWLVTELSRGDGLAVGLVTSLQFAPIVVLGVGAGTLGDRFDKRRLMIGTQIAVTLLCAGMVVLLLAGAMTVPIALVMALLMGIPAAVDAPVRLAYPRELVPRRLLPNAVGVNGAVFQLARIVGPAVAGGVIGLWGIPVAFAVTVVLGLAAGTALWFIPAGSGSARIERTEIPGWRETFASLGVSNTAMPLFGGLMVGISLTNLQLAVPLLLEPGQAGSFGILMAMIGAGGVVGASLASALGGNPRNRMLVIWAVAFMALSLAFPLMPTLLLMGATLFAVGAVMQSYGTGSISALQLRGEARFQSRLMTLYVVSFFIWTPVGAPAFGALCRAIGPENALLISATACLVLLLAGAWLLRRGRPSPVGDPS